MSIFENKKYPYIGKTQNKIKLKPQTLSEGYKNIKRELGAAFDYFAGKKKKKKPLSGENEG